MTQVQHADLDWSVPTRTAFVQAQQEQRERLQIDEADPLLFCFNRSFRNVEDLPAEQGVLVTCSVQFFMQDSPATEYTL